MNARLRSRGRPIRVAELLLPTVLTIAGRGPVSAENFLTWLASPGEPQEPVSPPAAGTRVTAAFPADPGRTSPEVVNP